jgi:hypothetical protein
VRAQGEDSAATVVLLVALLACLLLPALLSGGSGGASGSAGAGGLGDAPSSPGSVLWLSLDTLAAASSAGSVLAAAADPVDYVVGLINAGSIMRGEADWDQLSSAFIASLARNKDLRGAALATYGGSLYSNAHAALDAAVDQAQDRVPFHLHSVHGFGASSARELVQSATQACLAGSRQGKACPRVLETKGEHAVNAHIMAQLRQARAACSRTVADISAADVEQPKQATRLPGKGQQQQQQQQQLMQEHAQEREQQRRQGQAQALAEADEVDLPRVRSSVSESFRGPSLLKLFFVWLTRLFGFVLPFHRTYESLLHREHKMGEWRAYWTVYAMIHFLEDSLFIGLVYLMPIYLAAKVMLIGWCTNELENSLRLYNGLVAATMQAVSAVAEHRMPAPKGQ